MMSDSPVEQDFFQGFPDEFWSLLTANGKEYYELVGVETIKQLVLGVLTGENLRDETEFLTKRRLGLISAALLAHYAKLSRSENIEGIGSVLKLAISHAAKKGTPKEKKRVAQWFLGLTEKTMINVVGNNEPALARFGNRFFDLLTSLDDVAAEKLGRLDLTVDFKNENKRGVSARWKWANMLLFMATVGAMTLTIRGSEKSMYGKLFGNVVLGSVLSAFGYAHRPAGKSDVMQAGTFWLSDESRGRESDATLVYKPGRLVRFDIGFIGPGNPEISKDKLSRYERELENAGNTLQSKTIIIVDRLSASSRTRNAAVRIGAHIIQMSMNSWTKDLAKILFSLTGTRHQLMDADETRTRKYLEKILRKTDIVDFM